MSFLEFILSCRQGSCILELVFAMFLFGDDLILIAGFLCRYFICHEK